MLRNTLNELFQQWRPAFKQQRTCERAIDLAIGLLCGMGRRTITRAICFLGKEMQKKKNLSTHFRQMVAGLRQALDDAGHAAKTLVAVVDGSYCNAVTFAASLGERIALLARCRKDIRLCHPAPEGGRRVYGEEKFTPEDVAKDESIPWRKARIFHGGRFRDVDYKEVTRVLWQGGGKRRLLRLFVIRPVAYRKTKKGRLFYRQRAYLLCDDLTLPAEELLQSYFDRWEIEVNHRDEKDILGVGQSQVWADKSHPRQPAFAVAAYSLLLLAGLLAYGPARTNEYEALPKWRKNARRPSCLDLVTLLRRQTEEHRQQKHSEEGLESVRGYPSMVKTAAA